jgi:hypothetical protein
VSVTETSQDQISPLHGSESGRELLRHYESIPMALDATRISSCARGKTLAWWERQSSSGSDVLG